MSSLQVWGIEGLPEIRAGDDLAALLATAEPELRDGDVVVVTSKVVSKAEGRVRTGDREAAIAAETARVVARRGNTRIVQTHHGFVLAAAGVDGSNTEPGTIVLLPEDPDSSARRARAGLRTYLGVTVAVVISDTFGRPWRSGVTDVAVGLAGIHALDDLRGRSDSHGNVLDVTVIAAADEVAGAADLVKSKLTGVPAAVVRGLGGRVHDGDGPGVGPMLRPADEDLFRYGSRDVVTARRTTREFRQDPVDPAALRRAIGAAMTAPAPLRTTPCRFVLVESADARKRLLEAMARAWTGDLYADGHDEDAGGWHTREGNMLRSAPHLVVPCLVASGTPFHSGARRSGAERETLVAALGAGVENLLVALAAEGLGSCWAPSTMFRSGRVTRDLDLPPEWEPMGAVGVGHPAAPLGEHDPADPGDALIVR